MLALQHPAGNGAVVRLLGRTPALIQRSFVYSHVHGAIGGSTRPDAYYAGIGFQRVQSADGHWVWADPRNLGQVPLLNVPPLVLARYAPTAAPAPAAAPPPPAPQAAAPAPSDAPVLASGLQSASVQLDQAADRLQPLLSAASGPLPAGPPSQAAASPAPPSTRRVHMAALRVPTHDKAWQAQTKTSTRLALLKETVKVALGKWKGMPGDRLCVLTAPEYLFALESDKSHFMPKRSYEDLTAQLEEIAGGLPPNVLFIPGTIGWSQLVTELPAARESKAKAESAAAEPPRDQLDDVLRRLEAAHKACAALVEHGASKDLVSEWQGEREEAASGPPEDVRLVYNSALVYFGKVAQRYDKMFESVEGARDRLSDKRSLFMHGAVPFSDLFMGVRVSLEICSDYAAEAAKSLKTRPALQIVTASNYGRGGGGEAGRHLLLADSISTSSYDAGHDEAVAEETVSVAVAGAKGALQFSSNELPTE